MQQIQDSVQLEGYTVRAPAAWPEPVMKPLVEVLRKYWGYDRFLPLQEEAMNAVMQGRDSLLVLPTGGGKSLCYQVPAVAQGRTAIVVSPLISLMKDQVDALTENGIAAECLNSSLDLGAWKRVMSRVRSRELSLLYLAPERLVGEQTIAMLRDLEPAFIAVDEAHCISQWGHDFRPEYRAMGLLRSQLPGVPVHAYTATATERVRADIVSQLALKRPEVLVGSFDRPNLHYRVQHKTGGLEQVFEILNRHKGESGIVYCISRKEVERTCQALVKKGFKARPYHAGLDDSVRHTNQDAFLSDKCQIVVATVAFGMGIDKSNVRFVVHTGAPKSLEAYQQEAGRAGRDRLEAECTLLYSGGDFVLWRRLLEDLPPDAKAGALQSLQAMQGYATSLDCRHRSLVRHFGQDLEGSCEACDVCKDEIEQVADPQTIGRKILSCVMRVEQRFGADYTAKVLVGSNDKLIAERRHDSLSTYGLLAEDGYRNVRDWIEQLVGQGYLIKYGEFGVLRLTQEGARLLRAEVTPRLAKPRPQTKEPRSRSGGSSSGSRASRGGGAGDDGWEGVNRPLFEVLREVRKERADAARVPAYVVFSDATLREMARRRPTTMGGMRLVKGIGDQKLKQHGQVFLEAIVDYCREHLLGTDQ